MKLSETLVDLIYSNRLFIFLRYDVPIGLKNLWTYRKIVWNDRDWGYESAINLLEFKVRRMSSSFAKEPIQCETSLLKAAELLALADLLKELNEDMFYKWEKIPPSKLYSVKERVEHFTMTDDDGALAYPFRKHTCDSLMYPHYLTEHLMGMEMKHDDDRKQAIEKAIGVLLSRYETYWD